jgi:hypothetical protein
MVNPHRIPSNLVLEGSGIGRDWCGLNRQTEKRAARDRKRENIPFHGRILDDQRSFPRHSYYGWQGGEIQAAFR